MAIAKNEGGGLQALEITVVPQPFNWLWVIVPVVGLYFYSKRKKR